MNTFKIISVIRPCIIYDQVILCQLWAHKLIKQTINGKKLKKIDRLWLLCELEDINKEITEALYRLNMSQVQRIS